MTEITPEMTSVVLAIVALFAGIVTPAVAGGVAFVFSRAHKRAEWEREDTVTRAAIERERRQVERDNEAKAQLKTIHGLVNSAYTESIERAKGQTERLLRALVALHAADPTAETEADIAAARQELASLAQTIAERDAAADRLASDAPAP